VKSILRAARSAAIWPVGGTRGPHENLAGMAGLGPTVLAPDLMLVGRGK